MNKIKIMKIRYLVGAVFLLIFILGFVCIFMFKNELNDTTFSKFIALILFIVLIIWAESFWPSKKKNNKMND